MRVRLQPHAQGRLDERGVTEEEVVATEREGETFPAKFGRSGFRRNFPFDGMWMGRHYDVKQVEAYSVQDADGWLVITVVTRYF